MDDSKQLVTRSRRAQTYVPHNGSAGNFIHQGTDDTRAGSTLASRYTQIVIKEPSTAEPKRAKRKRITAEQLRDLTAVFVTTDTPTHDIREVLSKKLGMTNREVQVWFQNRRAKYNRQRLEQQRQMRTNAAIIYGVGMAATRAPLQAQPPPMPYAHLQAQLSHPSATPTRPLAAAVGNTGGQTGDMHLRKWPAPAPAAEPYVQACNPGSIQPYLTSHTLGGGGHSQMDDLPIDATRAAIAGNALLQLSEARAASGISPVAQAASTFARLPLGDPNQHVGMPRMQTPALTSASMAAYCAYSESPSASPHRPGVHGPMSQITSDASLPQCQRQQQQLLPRAFDRVLPPARRNTVSSYQNTSLAAAFSVADYAEQSPQAYPLPLPAMTPGLESMAARDRYQPEMPASYYRRHCRYSANRSPSPSRSHRLHFGADIPSAHVLPATNATLALQSGEASRGVKLPSIQTILAGVGHASSGASKMVQPPPLHPMPRSRAYTSPPLSTTEQSIHQNGLQLHPAFNGTSSELVASDPQLLLPLPPPTLANSQQPWTMVGEPENQYSNGSSSDANYCHESPVDEAKLAIDMLATAAVSVSSARSSCSLPHLTPLSEFTMRAGSQQQSSPTHTPSLQPQEAQLAETKGKPPRSWRPW